MIATAVPTRRREVLAIDIHTVLRPIWASVNPVKEKYAEFWPFRPKGNLTTARGGRYLLRSWNSFNDAIPNKVAPVNTMTKITAPNEKSVASDI